ncbi:hypothetical protein F4824DRAFT_505197 [Ustulina deusta]|nr:hypothetical protein F4824DRAFT_505197 [Ustulina deusta]
MSGLGVSTFRLHTGWALDLQSRAFIWLNTPETCVPIGLNTKETRPGSRLRTQFFFAPREEYFGHHETYAEQPSEYLPRGETETSQSTPITGNAARVPVLSVICSSAVRPIWLIRGVHRQALSMSYGYILGVGLSKAQNEEKAKRN